MEEGLKRNRAVMLHVCHRSVNHNSLGCEQPVS